VTTTLGIPGTGLSYSSRLPAAGPQAPRPVHGRRRHQALPRQQPTFDAEPLFPQPDKSNIWNPQPGIRAITSGSVETSESLRDLRDMIVAARAV